MRKQFSDLATGDKFHTGKCYGSGQCSRVQMWVEYQKIDKSHAKVTNQIGYGNTRMVGHVASFNAVSPVWDL